MLKKILKVFGALVGLVVLAVVGLIGYVKSQAGKLHTDMPLPAITRATAPEGIARGEHIFRHSCAGCHADEEGKMVGRPMTDLPPELGKMYAANLTEDPEAGVGAWKDEELARMIITGIDRNGKARPMIGFKYMSDEDVSNVIGYMRSGSPAFAAVKKHQPESESTLIGQIVGAFLFKPPSAPRGPVATPPKGNTAEYGGYLANALYDCFFCHTAGFSTNKLNEPNLYAGGFEFNMKAFGGQGKIYSSNLTPHPTAGIGTWTLEDFKKAMKEGISKDGSVIRPPMGRYRTLEEVELDAIYTYLKTVPVSDKVPPPTALPREKFVPTAAPEQLFSSLGCNFCHGPTGQFKDKLKSAAGKPPEEIAKWIRNPETFKPGTQMPSYAEMLDEGQSMELARWVLANKVEAGGASAKTEP